MQTDSLYICVTLFKVFPFSASNVAMLTLFYYGTNAFAQKKNSREIIIKSTRSLSTLSCGVGYRELAGNGIKYL